MPQPTGKADFELDIQPHDPPQNQSHAIRDIGERRINEVTEGLRHAEIVNMTIMPVEPKCVIEEIRAGKDLKNLTEANIFLDVGGFDAKSIVGELLQAVDLDPEKYSYQLLRMDSHDVVHFFQTVQGHQFIVVYATLDDIPERKNVLARLHQPLDLQAFDGSSTVFVALCVGPPVVKETKGAPETARTFATLLSDDQFFHLCRSAKTAAEIQEGIIQYYERVKSSKAVRTMSDGLAASPGPASLQETTINPGQQYFATYKNGLQWQIGRVQVLAMKENDNVEVKWMDKRAETLHKRKQQQLLPKVDLHRSQHAAKCIICERTKKRQIPGFGPESAGFCGGLISDVRRRVKYYWSDWVDGIHYKTIPTSLYIYFICMAPGVAFGSVTSENTNRQLGTLEVLITQWIMGLIFAFIGGNPLVILRHTGPLTVFTQLLYQVVEDLSTEEQPLKFMPFYAWTGIWLGIMLVVIAMTNACKLMKYLSRFTEEVFAMLINCIFVYEAFKPIVKNWDSANVAPSLVTLILTLGTFALVMFFDSFKTSYFFTRPIRNALSDYSSTLGIIIMTAIAYAFQVDDIPKVQVPDKFGLSVDRSLIVDLMDIPGWAIAASLIPALMAMLLFYVDENVTSAMTDNPDHKLVKGPAYHLDMFVVGLVTILLSVLGLPWAHGSLPHSPLHAVAYADRDDYVEHGRLRRRIVKARESRVSSFIAHTLILLSTFFLLQVLRIIPLGIFYGLFLTMAAGGLAGNSFFERILLWFTQLAHYPPVHYVRKVPLKVIHAYTFIQLMILVILWVVKSTIIGLSFPLIVMLTVPLRSKILPLIFNPFYLDVLDSHC